VVNGHTADVEDSAIQVMVDGDWFPTIKCGDDTSSTVHNIYNFASGTATQWEILGTPSVVTSPSGYYIALDGPHVVSPPE